MAIIDLGAEERHGLVSAAGRVSGRFTIVPPAPIIAAECVSQKTRSTGHLNN